MQDHDSPVSIVSVTATVADQEPVESATEHNQSLTGAKDTVTQMTDGETSATRAVATQEQQFAGLKEAMAEATSDQSSHKYVLPQGEELFKSLFAAEKTPPNSPGSVASSSTLIDSSSRKVSPLSVETLSKGSPTAVKDFAYHSPDGDRVDPLTMIEAETKKGLLKQLKKKTAAEEKASQKSEKLESQNKTLIADLKAARATVENRDAQADLAKVHANAMTMSNVVLRQIVKDITQVLSHENNGTRAQGTASEGEKKWDQSREDSLQQHLRGVDESSASAYGRMALLENASAVRGQGLNNTFSRESIQNKNPSPIFNVVESTNSGSVADQPPSRQASEEVQIDVVESSSSRDTNEEAQLETTFEESEGRPKEEVEGFFEEYGFNPAELSLILNSLTPTAQKESTKKDTEEVTQEEEALEEVQEREAGPIADEAVMTPLQDYQRQELNLDEESTTGQSQTIADPIGTNFEDATPDQDYSSEANGEDQVSEAADDTSPSAVEDPVSASDCNEDPANTEPTTNTMPSQDYANAIGSGHEGGLTESYEFSEPAGPATLWAILRSDQTENDANEITVDDTTADDTSDTGDDAASVCEPAGPATLWGILQSSQDENSARENANTGEDTSEAAGPIVQTSLRQHEANDHADAGEEATDTNEAPGPALLWGILRSAQGEEEAIHLEVASEKAANSPEAASPALLCGVLRSEQDENEVEGQEDPGNDAVDASDEEAPGPATLWGILNSDHDTSLDHCRDTEVSRNGRMDIDMVLEDSESTDTVGALDQDGTQPIGLPHDTTSPDSNEYTHGLHDTSDDKEGMPKSTDTPTDEECPHSSPHGSVNDDVIAVQEVPIREVVVEEALGTNGLESRADTVGTVTGPIGGSRVVEENEYEIEKGATEAVHLYETTIHVDAHTPVGEAEYLNEHAGSATEAQKEDHEQQAPEEANASEVTATSVLPKDSDKKKDVQYVENGIITNAGLLRLFRGWKSMLKGNIQATSGVTDDHELENVAIGSSSTTAEGSSTNSAVAPAHTLSPPIYPRASPELQVEEFDSVGPAPKPKRVKDPEKRRLERARAKAKVKEEKAKAKEEKALRRRMEEEAANTPEAVAQREAEEMKMLGDKRLKMQEAREKKWLEARLPEE